ncbi:rhodanese-related sulfurtransferase [Devosia subaequoris]|uniref:Rhodanese-related sulfurtransferase n=1 Tax=Devosia subaequoris TaxID=395930 RepID=A0A7W6IKQ4_9HYPH|nr:rhodanese-like domain-containing protein [Devosia subaequoris]MBB4051421.1 rhodanese-related sulfurtransferase [Devosia subaequoris]MCP1209015.1 rhodanese-like domain-containing protein [Devosia subaequoris]
MTKEVSRSDLAQAMLSKNPPIVFEALDKKYFDHGHLPGAIMMPPAEVAATAQSHVARRDAPVVIYCASDTCANSHEAASELSNLGYSNIAIFTGGKKDWADAGLKLER